MAETIYILLACWMIVSGLDDLWLDLCFLAGKRKRRDDATFPPPADLSGETEGLIALWVPAWREDGVIAQMIAHNVASIRYRRYHIFAGTYPNDEATLNVLRELEQQYPNVHISLTPHDGPTSKADNLNWVYQNLCEVEERLGERFDIVVIHDSEDLIHPEEFRWLNHYCRSYDFVQIPVLALPTPWWEFTHGIYCDEFAETQQKDLPTRNRLGGFAPSCGVGTGYRREALARLAEAESNRLFEPDSLTEDYLNGLRMHRLGMRQIYLPVAWLKGQPVATREYFPRRFYSAVRQRTRWVTGIALQTWQMVGWSRDWRENYWFWRDRKGLLGNPLSLVANGLLLLVLAGVLPYPQTSWVAGGLLLQTVRMGMRVYFSGLVYGWGYGALAVARIPWSNLVNTLATLSALKRYALARWRRQPLVWLKTEHAYPSRQALHAYRRRIGEVLVDLGLVETWQVEEALAGRTAGQRLGEALVERGWLDWVDLYRGLAVCSGFLFEEVEEEELDEALARSLPRGVMEEGRLQPVRAEGRLLRIATPEMPPEGIVGEVERYTGLTPDFVLVTPANFHRLRRAAEAPRGVAA